MHAAAVEVLIEKSKFAPHVALGIAEAIDMAIQSAQLVTVPVLDASFAASDSKAEARFGASDSKAEARFGASDSKVEARFGALEVKVEARFGALEVKMESIKAELVRWVFMVMLGNVALTAGVTAILNALQR